MRKRLILAALLALAPAAVADVFKWVDRSGGVHYGDTPPANARSRSVDLHFARSATPTEVKSCCVANEDMSMAAERPVYFGFVAEPPVRKLTPRGLDFGVFIMLRHGMSTGELLLRAGPPDYQSTDGNSVQPIAILRRVRPIDTVHSLPGRGPVLSYAFSNLIVETFYYYPTVSNPFTTVITLTGGRITDLQRTRQF
ncbi:MAG: DUF4124 domain-containing protein [Betaproteobacteria bacterium]